MAITEITEPTSFNREFIALSTDEKPVGCTIGTKLFEYDTGITYIYNGTSWSVSNNDIEYPIGVDATLSAIKAKTDNLPAMPATEEKVSQIIEALGEPHSTIFGDLEELSTLAAENAGNATIAADEAAAKAEAANAEALLAAEVAALAADNATAALAKLLLHNEPIVFLFPDTTDKTVELTAGNSDVWSSWTEIIDSASVKLSSKFATKTGYLGFLSMNDNSAAGDKVYMLELAWGSAKTILGRVTWPATYRGPLMIKSRRVPAGELTYYRLMCSGSNGSTAEINIGYFYEE